MQKLYFKPGENYFTLHFTSLNYENPGQSWYAYKLDGFDQDWIITQQPEAHYTNVPGGRYTFRFKVSTDAANWDVPEKKPGHPNCDSAVPPHLVSGIDCCYTCFHCLFALSPSRTETGRNAFAKKQIAIAGERKKQW
ncbi:MAG: hypothetical protein NVV59_08765 [Chitinophagaceae bacterium]|nr:hypothetical protein [Chitinophagaceae bacterium]